MKPLDLINTPLEGINLIEASAGTGKTYTIEGLFLRLILEKQLLVDQILVVTFTKAATAELEDRIRHKLLQAEKAFAKGSDKDPLLMALLERHADHSAAIAMIHDALVEFDRAPIFTIHGFCARILFEHAFETSNLFDTELVSDPSEWQRDVAEDFWRRHLYDAPLECIAYLTQKLKGPASFQKLLGKIGAAEIDIIPQMRKPDLNALPAFRTAFQDIISQWPASRRAVQKALADPALSGTHYGSLKLAQNFGGRSRRDLMILSLIEKMDLYVQPNNTGFPLFKNFEKFTARKLNDSVRKGQTAPNHDFFIACDALYHRAAELEIELQQYMVYLKKQLLDIAPTELKVLKADQNIQFFDDLLILVKQALTSKSGNPLADAVRRKYQAALVDEFQDTDSVQYDIFSRLFSDSKSLLFMIGDPKQAIYSFRGADVFSYLKAVRDAKSKFTLTENWRTQAKLINAVNTLFSNVKTPFLFEDISFQPARAGQKQNPELKNGTPPLSLWYLDSRLHTDQDKPVTKTTATRLIADAVAEEICQIAHPETGQWQTGDIAVLVRTNRQAQQIKKCLSAKGIPSVLYSTGNIFDSHEAMEIEKVLMSICEPDNPALLRAALAMDMMGARGEDLLSADTDVHLWQDLLIRIRQYHQLWRHSGFMQMFRTLLKQENVRQLLLPFADGERRLTNLLHLAEIIHQECTQRNFGMRATIKWLAEQRDTKSPRLEEHQLRLESDARAVQIVTIHKSKGLEYPVVFCPYNWEGSYVRDSEIIFHHPAASGKDSFLTMDLGSDAYDTNLVFTQNELLAENIRLLYVALTRAKHKCYLVWGRINTADSSALAYLLHAKTDALIHQPSADRVGNLKQQVKPLSDAQRLADLADLATSSRNTIEVVPLPQSSDRRFRNQTETPETLSCRTYKGKINTSWKVSSYSALISRQIADIDQPDRDALGAITRHLAVMDVNDKNLRKSAARDSIFAFPRGSRAGNFFHDIFEHLDYTSAYSDDLLQIIQRALQVYGFGDAWLNVVADTITNVLHVPLMKSQPELTLSAIDFEHRINEMEFYFPLKMVRPSNLQRLFNRPGAGKTENHFPVRMGQLTFSPVSGFMKGYIDLIFMHQNRFFLVDWKSNYLGPAIDDYRRDALADVMQTNYYVLQYHLYVLALCQYLRLKNTAFRYETDFGGALYLFIRGIDQQRNPEFGIYFDRPPASFINDLGKALIPDFEKFA